MEKANLIVLLFVQMLLSGCLAYRISGFSETTTGAESKPNSGPRYRIRDLRIGFDTTESERGFIIPRIVTMPRERVISAITAKSPSYFASSSDAVPVDVELQLHSTRTENAWSILVYICSIGVLPLWMDCISENDITVKIPTADKSIMSASMPLRLMYSYSLSCYTPLGGIPYSPIPNAISNSTKSPAFPGPSDDEVLAAFADSAAKVIVRAIAKCGVSANLVRPAKEVAPVVSVPVLKVKENVSPGQDEGNQTYDDESRSGKCAKCGAIKGKDGRCPLCD